MSQVSGRLVVDVLHGAGQLQVEVAIQGDQLALVLGLTPLQAHDDILVDEVLQHRPRVDGDEAHLVLCGGAVLGEG